MTKPIARTVKATGREDASSIPIRLLGSDVDAGDAVISFRLSSLPGNGTLFLDAAMTKVAKAGISYLASGEALQLYFKPAANFNGALSFQYTAFDGSSRSDPGTASLKVTAVNDAPIARADALTKVAEDSGARTIFASALLGNDLEGPPNEAGQILKIIGVSNAVGGTVQLVGGNVVFTPGANYNGLASFTYTVQDNGLTGGVANPKTASAKASFSVSRVNDSPTAKNDILTSVAEDSTARTISAADLLANDLKGPANESGQILKITGVSDAVGGTVALVDGNVVFTPTADFDGKASFTYTVQDNGFTGALADPKAATATVSFDVNGANDAPVAAAVTASGRDNSSSISITLSGTDPDAGDTVESFTVKSLPANGTLYLDAARTEPVADFTTYEADAGKLELFFVPNSDFVGSTSFTYSARDSSADGAPATASITTVDGFDIDFRYTGDESLRHFFTEAAARWEEIITADIPSDFVTGIGIVDDLNIAATIEFIDGVSGVLGSAGPDGIRGGSSLPLTGIMRFDSADVANLVAAGQFDEVILHEMGHVLGIGTMWGHFGLRNGFDYFGANALAEYRNLKGDPTLTSVPLENDGGPGTVGSHWEESIFDNELMTGFLDGGRANPISRMTVASLKDLGYQVDLGAADPYTLPAAGLRLDGGSNNEVGRFIALPDELLVV